MANDNTFDPSQNIGRQEDRQLGNLAVSSPFEPGSVNKIVTAASVIEFGLSNPDEVLQVPGSIDMGGVTVGDAWNHGVMPYTTTGIFGKSSNVGTLMLAQRIGPERYADMLRQVRAGPAHRRRPARRERGPGSADRPVVGQHLLQPAHRPRSFDDAAADDRDVPDHRQRRAAHPAADRQGHHRPRRHPHRRAPARRRAGGLPADRADRAQHAAGGRAARPDGRRSRAPGRRPPSRATRSPARPEPPSRSTPPAAATTATSTGSRSPAWPPSTIPATSSGS